MKLSALAFVFLTFNYSALFAKELTNRLGVGFRQATVYEIQSLAASYYPTTNMGVIGVLGVDTQEENSRFVFGAGLRRIIFKEEAMNFFGGGNLHLLSIEENKETHSGMELSGVFGAEFFLDRLDSLGFNFEAGFGVTNIKKVRFRTIADHLFKAGIFFYF